MSLSSGVRALSRWLPMTVWMPVGLTLALGMLVTLVFSIALHRQIVEHHQVRFHALTDNVIERTNDRMNGYISLLGGLGALYDASQSVDPDEFRTYAQALAIEHAFPGVSAVGYLPHLNRRDLARFMSMTRGGVQHNFELRPAPRAGAEIFAPVWLVEPFSGANSRMPGMDFFAHPVLAEALNMAASSGRYTLSGPVKLVEEWGDSQTPRVILIQPIYKKGTHRFTPEQRAEALQGYVFVALRIADMLAGLGDALNIDLEVYDGEGVNTARLLFDTDGHRASVQSESGRFAHRTEPQPFAQRMWTLYMGTMPGFEADVSYTSVYIVVVGGAFTTGLVILLVGYLGTARQRAQTLAHEMTEQLRQSHDELLHLNNELGYQKRVLDRHAIVSVANPQGEILDVNDAYCASTGYPREALLGRNHNLVKSGKHSQAFYAVMWKTIASGHTWQGELCNRTRDGREIWLSATIVPFLDEQGKLERYVAAYTDITSLKQARDELQLHHDRLQELVYARTREAISAQERAEAASRSKSEFLANMSHELRTPMHAVLSYSELGESKAGQADFNADRVRNYFQRIHQSGRRLLNLINDLLDLSKMEAGRMQYTMQEADMPRLVTDVSNHLSSLLMPKGLQIDIATCKQETAVWFDPARMEQVLINLLSNAIRFSPEGGVIHIQCSAAQLQDARQDGAWVPAMRVSIADEGPGIPDGELESIFDPFVQASHSKSGAGGTGLGLAICREILRAHGGEIHATNLPGGGACLVFEFPVTPVPA